MSPLTKTGGKEEPNIVSENERMV